jgi:tRNA(fMet)-specific endonuclease VapC
VIHLDTSFLADLHEEVLAERPGEAFDMAESLDSGEVLAVSVHAVAELRVGAELARRAMRSHEALDRFLSAFLVIYPDGRFPAAYARIWAAINRSKRSVAAMDLLIATAALLDEAPLVTRNVKDFSRVPGLRVLGY